MKRQSNWVFDWRETRRLINEQKILLVNSQISANYRMALINYQCKVAHLLDNIVDNVALNLGIPPCGFALLGLGSFGRGDFLPQSDLDPALLIKDHNQRNHPYFREFISLVNVYLKSLLFCNVKGKSPALVYVGHYLDETFVSFMTNNQTKPLIQAPNEMAKWVVHQLSTTPFTRKSAQQEAAVRDSVIIAYALLCYQAIYISKIENSKELVTAYGSELNNLLNSLLKNTSELEQPMHQFIAEHAMQAYREQYLQVLLLQKESSDDTASINIKECSLQHFLLACSVIALYFNLPHAETASLLKSFSRYIHPNFLIQLKQASNFLQQQRLQQLALPKQTHSQSNSFKLKANLERIQVYVILLMFYFIDFKEIKSDKLLHPGLVYLKHSLSSKIPNRRSDFIKKNRRAHRTQTNISFDARNRYRTESCR